jgi:hypothetical protein
MNRLEGTLDGLLHLMDRQVVDSEGLLVCKCDDLELSQTDEGRLVVTALLVGAPVWVPRLGSWLSERWSRLGGTQADRERPYRIDLGDVARVTQEITLRHPRDGVLRRQEPGQYGVRRLVGDLLGSPVESPSGEELGKVLDVRLEPSPEPRDHALVLTHLLVGRGRPGSYLGYDRSHEQGPWLVARIVRWVHRDSGMVPIDAVDSIDWQGRRVRVTTGLEPLTHSGTVGEPERDG